MARDGGEGERKQDEETEKEREKKKRRRNEVEERRKEQEDKETAGNLAVTGRGLTGTPARENDRWEYIMINRGTIGRSCFRWCAGGAGGAQGPWDDTLDYSWILLSAVLLHRPTSLILVLNLFLVPLRSSIMGSRWVEVESPDLAFPIRVFSEVCDPGSLPSLRIVVSNY